MPMTRTVGREDPRRERRWWHRGARPKTCVPAGDGLAHGNRTRGEGTGQAETRVLDGARRGAKGRGGQTGPDDVITPDDRGGAETGRRSGSPRRNFEDPGFRRRQRPGDRGLREGRPRRARARVPRRRSPGAALRSRAHPDPAGDRSTTETCGPRRSVRGRRSDRLRPRWRRSTSNGASRATVGPDAPRTGCIPETPAAGHVYERPPPCRRAAPWGTEPGGFEGGHAGPGFAFGNLREDSCRAAARGSEASRMGRPTTRSC